VTTNLPRPSGSTPLVERATIVPKVDNYQEYRELLRYDFLHSCAYCTMSEAEAGAVRFTIDHYEPRTARADLISTYDNLFWACDECNRRKGDLTPPPKARAAGIRFFRVDQDIAEDHFRLEGLLLKHRTSIGDFTIEYVDLNRQALKRLREIRCRLAECEQFVREGVYALKGSQIDRLLPDVRGRVFTAIMRAARLGDQLADEIDGLLREAAKSKLIDPDPQSEERAASRKERMKRLQGLFEGSWRGRDQNNQTKS
jgi:hypothetical protein